MWNEIQFLVNDGYALFHGIFRTSKMYFFTIQQQISFKICIYAGKNFHQSGFTSSIFAYYYINFSSVHIYTNIIKRTYACKFFSDIDGAKNDVFFVHHYRNVKIKGTILKGVVPSFLVSTLIAPLK